MRMVFPLICWCCAFCLAFATGGDTCNDQSYNNAWKVTRLFTLTTDFVRVLMIILVTFSLIFQTLEGFESGYVKYVTFDTPLRCPSVKRVSLHQETQTAHYVGTLNTKDDKTM